MKRIFRTAELALSLFIALLIALTTSCSPAGHGGHGEEEEGEEHGHSDELELTQAQMDAVGIRLGVMERREMTDELSLSGRLEVAPGDEASAAPKLAGTVTRICVGPGQTVKAGQVVAYIDAPELTALRQQWREAQQEVGAARVEADRQQALAAQGAGVRKNLDAARAALAAAELREQGAASRLKAVGAGTEGQLAVTAPISGTVTAVNSEIGAFADMQTPLVRIVNNAGVYCLLQVLEKDAGVVRPGMEVEMRLTNDPSVTFLGVVEDAVPVLDTQTRTLPVRVRVTSGDRSRLIPGMAVSARAGGGGEAVDALPEQAVVSSGGRHYIFVEEVHGAEPHDHDGDIHEENEDAMHFRKVEVAVGITSMGYTAVTPLEPLEPEARIVVEGAFYLASMSTDHGEHAH